jgi:hypothetical protein
LYFFYLNTTPKISIRQNPIFLFFFLRGGGRGMRWNLKNQKFKIAYFEKRNTQESTAEILEFGGGISGGTILPPHRTPRPRIQIRDSKIFRAVFNNFDLTRFFEAEEFCDFAVACAESQVFPEISAII